MDCRGKATPRPLIFAVALCLVAWTAPAACSTCCLLLHSVPGKSAVPAKPGDRSSHLGAGVAGEAFTFPTAFQQLAVCYS